MRDSARFFRWYRVVPLLAVTLVAAASLLATLTPSALLRRFLYPLDHREAILASSSRHGVDPTLVCAVIQCESNWNDSATSAAGAVGLMQLMPDTATTIVGMGLVGAEYDPENLRHADTNIEFGCAYLGYLQEVLDGEDQVVAAYNAGIGTVQSWLENGIVETDFANLVSYPETRLYLMRVTESHARYRELYDSELNPR